MMKIRLHRSDFLLAIQNHDSSATAIIHNESSATFTYQSLFRDVACARARLLSVLGRDASSLAGERIAFMIENSYHYVVMLLTILASNAIAVPLAPGFPISELRHIINDSESICLMASAKHVSKAQEVSSDQIASPLSLHSVEELFTDPLSDPEVLFTDQSEPAKGGMMLYTSGTTARPKGVLLTIETLEAQAHSLLSAWNYSARDHLLHVLPLHHIHGTVNALLTPLLAGTSIEFQYPFNAQATWKRLAAPFLHADNTVERIRSNGVTGTSGSFAGPRHSVRTPVTFFTAVPTIWARMLQTFPTLAQELQKAGQIAANRRNLRLNISGSAALPKPTCDRWSEISGNNILLERYGMTEVGMALSCGLDDADRIPGSVGWPLPFVEARLWEVDEKTGAGTVIPLGEEIDPIQGKLRQGEIQLRGKTVFTEYWRNPAATEKEFTEDGWFKTGDVAVRREVKGAGQGRSGSWARGPAYFIQGRQSADIIKTGGEKVSALEIERELLALPEIDECAVVGLQSDSWGQKVVAVVVLSEECKKSGAVFDLAQMRRVMKQKLVPYKIPQDMEVVTAIKRNAMGKVNKKELVPTVFGTEERIRRRSFLLREERERQKSVLVK